MRSSLPLAGLALLTTAGCATALPHPTAPVAAPAEPRVVQIAASATLHVAPDRACVELTFSELAPRLVDAHAEVERRHAAFLEALGALDGALEIESGSTLYAPEHTHRGGERVSLGYRASRSLTVRTADRAQVPEIIGRAGDGLHAVQVIHYREDLSQFRSELRALAVGAARDKAAQLAAGFGDEIARVLSVTEGGARAQGRGYFATDNVVAGAGEDASEGPPPPGAIALQLTLTVTFELRE